MVLVRSRCCYTESAGLVMLYVRDKRRWLRFKALMTAILAFITLASVGGLEGTQPVPSYSWWLLLATGALVVNITNDFCKQYDERGK